jgi:hypothetical protein
MTFMCEYQVDRDKQSDTQAFFANMTDEQAAGEFLAGVKNLHVGTTFQMETVGLWLKLIIRKR